MAQSSEVDTEIAEQEDEFEVQEITEQSEQQNMHSLNLADGAIEEGKRLPPRNSKAAHRAETEHVPETRACPIMDKGNDHPPCKSKDTSVRTPSAGTMHVPVTQGQMTFESSASDMITEINVTENGKIDSVSELMVWQESELAPAPSSSSVPCSLAMPITMSLSHSHQQQQSDIHLSEPSNHHSESITLEKTIPLENVSDSIAMETATNPLEITNDNSATHPTYLRMVVSAIEALNEHPKKGSSRQAIQKYVINNYDFDDIKRATRLIKRALVDGCKRGKLRLIKGTGATGSFALEKAMPPEKISAGKSFDTCAATHPPYQKMIVAAIKALNDHPKKGSSRQAILKYVIDNYNIDDTKRVKSLIKKALVDGCEKGKLRLIKGTGATGSFALMADAAAATAFKDSKVTEYWKMASAAIVAHISKDPTEERASIGPCRQAILKHIMDNNQVGDDKEVIRFKLNKALVNGINSGTFQRTGGKGLAGTFTIGKNNRVYMKRLNKLLKVVDKVN